MDDAPGYRREATEAPARVDREAVGENHPRSGASGPEIQRRWILVSQDDVIRKLGVPDRIIVTDTGGEVWKYYSAVDARGERVANALNVSIRIERGRVVSVSW